jgi:hypothetical protein
MQLPGGNEELGSQKLGILTSAKAMIGDALHERSEWETWGRKTCWIRCSAKERNPIAEAQFSNWFPCGCSVVVGHPVGRGRQFAPRSEPNSERANTGNVRHFSLKRLAEVLPHLDSWSGKRLHFEISNPPKPMGARIRVEVVNGATTACDHENGQYHNAEVF